MKTPSFFLPGFAAALLLLPLPACTHTAAGPAKSAAAAAPAVKPAPPTPVPGAAVTFTEADTTKTAHLSVGQTVAIKLAVNESTGNRWFLRNSLTGGVVVKKGNTTYTPNGDGATATLLYQGVKAGSQELHFYYAPPDARQNVGKSADYRVIVK